MLIENPYYGVLEVHSTRTATTSSPAVSVTQLKFPTALSRANFAKQLIKEEDLGVVQVQRIFTPI